MIRTSVGTVCFTLAVCGIGVATVRAGDAAATDLQPPLHQWEERAARLRRLRIEWRPAAVDGPDRFARYASEWTTPEPGPVEPRGATLQLDGDRLLYSAWRTAARPHGYEPEQVNSITAAVGAAHPERIGPRFLQALLAGFPDPAAEQRPVQRFDRSYDGTTLHDFWTATAAAYPRATLHSNLPYGTDDWATLHYEHDPTDQLQTLELMAVLLAVRPRHPLLAIRTDSWGIEPDRAVIDGAPCLVLREYPAGDAGPGRTLMIDPERDGIVRRWIGGRREQGVQVDLSYRHNPRRGWLPESWTVLRFGAADRPVQQYLRGTVTAVDDGAPLDDDRLRFRHPPGTWVVEHTRGENYLVRTGDRRPVTAAELRWLPQYAELLQSNSGQVGDLIQHRSRRAEQWRSMRWPLLGAGALLIAAALARWQSAARRKRPAATGTHTSKEY